MNFLNFTFKKKRTLKKMALGTHICIVKHIANQVDDFMAKFANEVKISFKFAPYLRWLLKHTKNERFVSILYTVCRYAFATYTFRRDDSRDTPTHDI